MRRIPLGNTEFEGRNNAYLLSGEHGVGLVDTAIARPEPRQQLEAALGDAGYAFADIDTVVLTHWHPDHAGLAGAIQNAGGATVHVHELDAPLVRQEQSALDALRDRQRSQFTAWGMPESAQLAVFERLDTGLDLAGEAPAVEAIAPGEQVTVGDRVLDPVHAPGHTAGSCYFIDPDTDAAFVGDVVLPVYTPNIGGADVRVERPLATYLATLRELHARDLTTFWPGHRDPIDDPADRIETIIDHHRERTERVIDVLAEHGPADAWTVSAHLFGELEGIHILHGPGEAFAHLEHLVTHDVVAETSAGYQLTDPDTAESTTLV